MRAFEVSGDYRSDFLWSWPFSGIAVAKISATDTNGCGSSASKPFTSIQFDR